ncbi:response regulator transcription factor [Luteolibacter luteus]|uniref:Response regulator transcription factor n=1 Tax=Luteolibacter luteus TaxID=2728835 RepID=A0A858RCE3_9BACT|nr:response regulator [Luteolibacter luteus]QJE94268.1 response regulator transcription factor [Luteolibacter luteus]
MEDGKKNTIYLLDDDPLILGRLGYILEDHGYATEVYTDPTEFLQLQAPLSESCLLVDFQMPKMDGIQVQNFVRDRNWNLPMIFMSAYGTVPVVATAMKQGGVDFIQKPLIKAQVLSAVDRALHISRERHLARTEAENAREMLGSLTEREFDVLDLLVRGLLNKQIAVGLGIGERTVKVHRSRILTKLGVNAVPLLVPIVMAAGLKPEKIR